MATFATLQQAIKALSDDEFVVFTGSQQPATEAELVAIEATTGRPLPAELRKLWATWGVLVVEVKETLWPRVEPGDVAPAWKFSHGFRVLGIGAAIPSDLTVQHALTPAVLALGVVPFLSRINTKWLTVLTATGTASWQLGYDETEEMVGDAIDRILDELETLRHFIGELRRASLDATALVATARAASWKGPAAASAIALLKQRPPAELAPHLSELVDALLPPRSLSMGCLDIVAAAGAPAFPPVAARVYAHFQTGDAQWVLQLLGKLGDGSPEALAIYREGFASDDDDVYEKTLEAVKEIASSSAARELLPAIEERLEGELETAARGATLALLGLLGEPFVPRVSALLEELPPDEFASLVDGLNGLPIAGSPLAAELLAFYRQIDPKSRDMIGAIESLANIGVDEPATMAPILREHFLAGRFAKRAQQLLDRWPRA